MADAQPMYSTDVDRWLLENFPTAKGAKDAYDAFAAYLYGSEVDEDEDGDDDAKPDSSDEEDRKAVELALTWHATSTPPPLLERYLGLGLRRSSVTSEPRPAAAIIPAHGTGSAATATLLERMSSGNPSRVEWRSSPRINQREEFLRRTAPGRTASVLQELPTNRPSHRSPKDAKAHNNSRGGSRGPPPHRRSHDFVRDDGPGRDLRYDHPRGGGHERSDSTAHHMPPRRPYAAVRKDKGPPPRCPTNSTAPISPRAPLPPEPAHVSREPSPQVEQRMPTSQPQGAPLVQSPATVPASYLRLATDPSSRGLMARIYKLVAIAYMYRACSVRMQHVINALCVAYQSTDPASQPEVPFNPPSEWHEAMMEAFLPKMLVDFAEEDTRDVANELLETILEVEKAIENKVQPSPLRKYLVVALILYIEHLIEFGAETFEEMKDWPRDP
ncbi:hypothetical protein EXIGLDRAFT_749342 [Exidia glandulosa HHB12029]|uniref:Uncharacterized protein n=1 Tax=Exidia glandulosa HHB12029 TaxID=1314781 RepID=A0A165I9R3_EXIGL|nr:hypothetical protein EXIGLDRAFT_749342 [Exidia glandulosa HHB12029]